MRLLLLILCGLAGCGRNQDTTGPSDPQQGPAAATSVKASHQNVNENSAKDETGALLNRLTQAVRRYGVEQQRRPSTLEEVVAQGYLKELPQAPAGKKFVIDKKLEVTLEKR